MTISDVASLVNLDWDAVKNLDKLFMREQLRRTGHPAPLDIEIDEISIRKGHTYRIIVSDLDARRRIWFSGEGCKESDMAMFYSFLGQQQSQKIDIAVMDMLKPFNRSTRILAPQAYILFDKFHVIRHLSDALDAILRSEYKHVKGDGIGYIKGQRYVLLSRRENFSEDGRKTRSGCWNQIRA